MLALLDHEDSRWRSHACEHATTPLQHPDWLEVLVGAYGLKARVAALLDADGKLTAALPMVASRLPWRRRWTALPFTDILEPVAPDTAHADQLMELLAQRTELHPLLVRARVDAAGWFSRRVGSTHVLDLSNGRDGVLQAATRQTRQNVRSAERAQTEVRLVSSRSEFMGPNLALIARSRSRVGVPTQPRRYWSRIWEMHERGEALTVAVYAEGVAVASAIFLLGRTHAVFKYSASDVSTRKLRTNYLALISAIDHLCAAGATSLDFGITDTSNETLCQYKRQWGAQEEPAFFSATDAQLLPDTIQPGRLLSGALQRTPPLLGRALGSLAYPFAA